MIVESITRDKENMFKGKTEEREKWHDLRWEEYATKKYNSDRYPWKSSKYLNFYHSFVSEI